MLIITLSTSGVLQAMSTFPSQCKNKSAYFIKKKLDEPVSDQNVEASIIYGDLCAKPIDQLAVLTEEVNLKLNHELFTYGKAELFHNTFVDNYCITKSPFASILIFPHLYWLSQREVSSEEVH